ncbi:hypothetical protein GCM10009793_24820 [Brachybacterium phenoliresistens]
MQVLESVAAVVTAGATVLLAIYAYSTAKAAKDTLMESRKASKLSARPYVSVAVLPGLQGTGRWDLVLENTGRSLARDVRVKLLDGVKPLEGGVIGDDLTRWLSQPHTLAPGARIRIMWRWNEGREGSSAQADGMPSRSRVALSYRSTDGTEVYGAGEVYEIETDLFGKASPAPQQGSRVGPSPSESQQTRALKNIDRAIRALNTHVGELRR